jgi:hypothetical protein
VWDPADADEEDVQTEDEWMAHWKGAAREKVGRSRVTGY